MLKSLIKRSFCIRFSETHEFLKLTTGKNALLGISHHAKSELGEIIFVDLNVKNEGEVVDACGEVASLESVKAAASVYSPVKVKLLKKNSNALVGINKDSEEDGWLWEVEIQEKSEFLKLMTLDEYKKKI